MAPEKKRERAAYLYGLADQARYHAQRVSLLAEADALMDMADDEDDEAEQAAEDQDWEDLNHDLDDFGPEDSDG